MYRLDLLGVSLFVFLYLYKLFFIIESGNDVNLAGGAFSTVLCEERDILTCSTERDKATALIQLFKTI